MTIFIGFIIMGFILLGGLIISLSVLYGWMLFNLIRITFLED